MIKLNIGNPIKQDDASMLVIPVIFTIYFVLAYRTPSNCNRILFPKVSHFDIIEVIPSLSKIPLHETGGFNYTNLP